MATADLVDYSPHQPVARQPIPTASNVILIDNYDSFTWNVYQYLVLEGAKVTVYRNDEISLADLIAKNPTHLVISPGPGHPSTDAGISNDAIRYFSGKIPILGVCLGAQSMYIVFGGTVDVTGEIAHGKTSLITHDGKGCFEGLAQNLPVTRYHSLAGIRLSLPACLEISSRTKSSDGMSEIIMGVRHKEYTVEGIQFHPESILTAEGRPMIYNFLRLQGGRWKENNTPVGTANLKSIPAAPQDSILDKIYKHRKAAVAAQKREPGHSFADLEHYHNKGLAPSIVHFPTRLKQTAFALSLMAEIKRASPSKGVIAMSASAPSLATEYAEAGASTISVLTEPEWFKGTIDDLRDVRKALDQFPSRPAILRKDFIFEEYQILEARIAGADTILLIVKMLEEPLLKRLFKYSQSLGMEPLVEVNNAPEMQIALSLGAKVIGVNNRNLTNFHVDLETTSKLTQMVPKGTVLCALSGIAGPSDVTPYLENGVGAVLVGEALMRALNVQQCVNKLLKSAPPIAAPSTHNLSARKPLVKICGTRTVEAAEAAIKAGADMIGIILVLGRKRSISNDVALRISAAVHSMPKPKNNSSTEHDSGTLYNPDRALLVGVFQDQTLSYIIQQQKLLQLDVVQLHGKEPLEWIDQIPVPVIKLFEPSLLQKQLEDYNFVPLLDSGAGGTGQTMDMHTLKSSLESLRGRKAILAGGLNPHNVGQILQDLAAYRDQIVAVDVSSGVEQVGIQNTSLIQQFVSESKK